METPVKNSLIVWEKWIDPFDPENLRLENHVHEHDSLEDETIDHSEEEDMLSLANGQMKVLVTPIGLLPMDILSNSEKFNFWIGHTNFDITSGVANVIEKSNGVEILDIITRYRFRIGIGKIFTDRDVMKEINDNVYEHIEKYYE